MQTASLDILEKTQLPAHQARAILTVMEIEMTAREEVLASKGELKEAFHSLELKIEALRGDMSREIGSLRADLLGEIRGSEGKLMRWVFTCMLGQTAVIAGAVYFAMTHLRP